MKSAKRFGLMLALPLAIGLFALFALSPEAQAATAYAAPHADTGLLSLAHAANLVLAVGADALRAQHADYVARASAKIAEVKDGLPAADVTRIEGEHAALVRDVATIATALATAERAPPVPPAKPPTQTAQGWSGEDIGKVTARAKAFGLSADDATTVMADVAVRTLEQATDRLQSMAAAKTSPS